MNNFKYNLIFSDNLTVNMTNFFMNLKVLQKLYNSLRLG
jgi:hypothetical protein